VVIKAKYSNRDALFFPFLLPHAEQQKVAHLDRKRQQKKNGNWLTLLGPFSFASLPYGSFAFFNSNRIL